MLKSTHLRIAITGSGLKEVISDQSSVVGGKRWRGSKPNVVRLTLFYIISEAVIPAPYQVRGKLQRESSSETLDSPVSSTGQA